MTLCINPHLQPWSISADDFPASSFASDQLEHLLGYAVLAPSTHNTQPWLFRINAMGEIVGRGGYPQILVRLGYGPQIAPTPRRSVRTVLVRQSGGHAQR
ncbi:MAG: hypothetical protein ACYDH9_06275 [Limisphaerales bacterium]